jgi:hypothetical protein
LHHITRQLPAASPKWFRASNLYKGVDTSFEVGPVTIDDRTGRDERLQINAVPCASPWPESEIPKRADHVCDSEPVAAAQPVLYILR